MLRTRAFGSLAAAVLLAAALGLPAPAEAAHGHHGVYVGVGLGYGWGPYWGWGAPYWGWGWGPGPYYYGREPGNGMLGYAMMSGMGGLDVDAKPNRAEVWVDGRFVADARELDGDPSYLWLKQGVHHVVLYKEGYKSFDEDVLFTPGVLRQLKVQLEKGESRPPVAAPADARREPARPESGERRVDVAPRPEPAQPRPEAEGPGGGVRLRVEPQDAVVYVDGQYRGTGREVRRLRLSPGHHRIELVRPGYQQLQKEFDVEADKTAELELTLERGGH